VPAWGRERVEFQKSRDGVDGCSLRRVGRPLEYRIVLELRVWTRSFTASHINSLICKNTTTTHSLPRVHLLLSLYWTPQLFNLAPAISHNASVPLFNSSLHALLPVILTFELLLSLKLVNDGSGVDAEGGGRLSPRMDWRGVLVSEEGGGRRDGEDGLRVRG
jgi:hypothetical protein